MFIRPPKIEWVKEIVQAADKAGNLVFLKDNLKPLINGRSFEPTLECTDFMFTGQWQLRQEMPTKGG